MLAWACAELGREAEARRVVDSLAHHDFGSLPRDRNWLLGGSLLSEAVGRFGDSPHAAVLYELLRPYIDRFPISPTGGYCYGSAARPLGLLATTLSRFEEAESHFELALERNAHVRARPQVAHTQHDYASMLLRRRAPGDIEKATDLVGQALVTTGELGMKALEERLLALGVVPPEKSAADFPRRAEAPQVPTLGETVFRREGDYWSVTFGSETVRLKDTKGLHYLALLLQSPGREFHAGELLRLEAGTDSTAGATEQMNLPASGDAGEILDPRAKGEYRRRLEDLRGELEEARSFNDPERARGLEEELDFLTRELAGGLGLGDRSRRAGSYAERARINVTRALRTALRHIAERSPALDRHLTSTIKTGIFCSYDPDPRVPIDWKT
jgi:hypothetical protein